MYLKFMGLKYMDERGLSTRKKKRRNRLHTTRSRNSRRL